MRFNLGIIDLVERLLSVLHLLHEDVELIQVKHSVMVCIVFDENCLERFYLVFHIESPLVKADLRELSETYYEKTLVLCFCAEQKRLIHDLLDQ